MRAEDKKREGTVGDRQRSMTEPEQKSLYPGSGGDGEAAPQGERCSEASIWVIRGPSVIMHPLTTACFRLFVFPTLGRIIAN